MIASLVLLVSTWLSMHRSPPAPPVVLVERDTAWRGEVRVDGVVHVRKGATLTLAPGTKVRFSSRSFPPPKGGGEHDAFTGSGIRVEGRIEAAGTEEEPILFTSASAVAKPGDWDKLYFSFSEGNRFEHVVVEGGTFAFHSHFSSITIRDSLFRRNEEGLRLGASRVTVTGSAFTENPGRAINFRDCRNEITGNLVWRNGDGLFLHSKSSPSVVRGNLIYGNERFDVRLGDLHGDDADLSGNWWDARSEEELSGRIYDGRKIEGIGRVRTAPILLRLPPSRFGAVRGVAARGNEPAAALSVRAYRDGAEGFLGDGYAAATTTDGEGLFSLPLPPGRWFLAAVGERRTGEPFLFAYPGKNPVTVELFETADAGLPAVRVPPSAAPSASPSAGRSSFSVRVTLGGAPVPGAVVTAYRDRAFDYRGAGEASSRTGEDGTARLTLPPGRWFLAARKRLSGADTGAAGEGDLLGISPWSPVELPAGTAVTLAVPLFEKKGLMGGEPAAETAPRREGRSAGSATLGGEPAAGYLVYLYPRGEAVGRPLARSAPVSPAGSFTVDAPSGEYDAWLREGAPANPAAAGEARFGPVAATLEGGAVRPDPLPFRRAEGGEK